MDIEIRKETAQAIRQFSLERDWDQFHTPENIAKSIAIEAAELLECFQWGQEVDGQAVAEELADVVNYCIVMAQRLELDLNQVVLDKLEKNKVKYPVDKCLGNSTKYDKL